MNRRLQQRIEEISNADENSTYTPGRDGLTPEDIERYERTVRIPIPSSHSVIFECPCDQFCFLLCYIAYYFGSLDGGLLFPSLCLCMNNQ